MITSFEKLENFKAKNPGDYELVVERVYNQYLYMLVDKNNLLEFKQTPFICLKKHLASFVVNSNGAVLKTR